MARQWPAQVMAAPPRPEWNEAMSTDPDGPADTTMMGIVHGALRRDLERARLVLAEPLAESRRAALSTHLVWMMQFLRHHHEGEDTGLYPLVRAKDASLVPQLDAMDSEHAAIHPAMAEVEAAASAWGADAGQQPRVGSALAALALVLDPHLLHEELDMMPLVAKTVTAGEWAAWDQATNVKSKKAPQLAFEGHWLIDNARPADRSTVVHLVPAIPRFVLVNFLGGAYRKRRKAMWEGTPAADVPLLTLDELDRRG
jgi:hemerythrin-like domain-containing protein